MSLSNECSFCFDAPSRRRGEDYFAARRVSALEVDENTVFASVQGTMPIPYEVEIRFDRIGYGEIVADCDCPRSTKGDLCKHIYAALRAIDTENLVDSRALTSDLFIIHHSELDDFDDEDLSPVYPPRGNHSRSINASSPRGITSEPSWKRQLNAIAAAHNSDSELTADFGQAVAKATEAWFVLDVGASTQRGGLVVDFQHRVRRKDGSWGKIKRLSVRRNDLSALTDAEDRELVQLLLGNEPQQESAQSPYYYGSSYYGYASYSRALVTPVMYDVLLPKLCATGRFIWLLDGGMPAEDGQPIAWEGGQPWNVQVRVDSREEERQWELSGELIRSDETRPLSDPVMLLAHGLVLFPESIARLDARDDFSWLAVLRQHNTIRIPHEDREEFLHQLWSVAAPRIELPQELQLEQVVGVPQGRLSIRSPDRYGRSNMLYGDIGFVYEDRQISLVEQHSSFVDMEQGRVLRRDKRAELRLLTQLGELGLQPSSHYHQSAADVQFPVRRLQEVVERLTGEGWQVESEGRLIRRPGSVRLNVTSDVDWFEVDGQVDFGGVDVPLPRLLKALRGKQKYIQLDDGTQGILPEEWLQRFGSLVDMGDQEDESLRFAPSQALLLDALLAAQEDVQVDEQFDEYRKRLRNFGGITPGKEPRGFQGKLRGYQREGLGWLEFLREFGLGGCLADDMGLGKTVQVLAMLQSRRVRRLKKGQQRRPSIVVVPKSLVFNWVEEAAKFAPRLRVVDYTGLGRAELLEHLDECDLLITTYGTLRRDIVKLKDIRFDHAILDESQAIKNANSQAAKACRLLQADHRLAMTGTPIENHLGELWSLFEFLNPGMLGRSTAFQTFIKNRGEDDDSVKMLAQSLRPFLLRRTKEQVLTELPEKTEQTLHCEMSPKQRKLYDELRDYYRESLNQRVEEMGLEKAKIHVLEALLRLRQAACHPGLLDSKREGEPSAKLDLLLDQVQEIADEGHKALVFSQFTSLLSIVRKQLDKRGINYEYLDGKTTKRKERVDAFQNNPDCPLFLISLKAGGHGLNLTAADYVFILDPWWNPAVEAQAIDRAHRIGQTRHVFAYRLICNNTVEDKIIELQQSKRELAEAIVSADNSLIRKLTTEDLQLLLS